ncbi:mediator of DNA damage checkpoint protein 1-like isoform X1 [Thamnophis elegans]|uniref:mediator of DNA damage checkpoint protein 1-like isoform X1 n=1 Tax=Thamnophis elegans TaxID=35005 RepID=UPI001376844F|nr:mediator of DNA damage checkpoint protein 1-like isoform X1 [Thamnophis elegans]
MQGRMEQTQLLWDGEGDSTDGSDAARETPNPVGRLHLLSSKYGPEKDFWIYPGENTIGRLESCHVCLPANSVSKVHAVIEVPSSHGPHLLYDQGSLNRTRRQRMNLIPQVRYSLQDGDTLLFADVGCQYFILVPEADYDSHDDSMAVPPTQGRVEASALVIEETPAPGRKIGFGQVLVQDSDKEEEGEEVINGTGSYLHHASKDESGCSNKNGTGEGQASLASFGVSSLSATVVPESDDENGDPPVGGSPCPALRLSFESQEAERSPVEDGGSPSSNREDCGEPIDEEEAASAEHGLVEGFHLDSDTDVEDENQMSRISEVPASLDPEKRDRAPELDPDTDLNESSLVAPAVHCPQTPMELGSDTDAEESVESPAVSRLKLPSASMEKEEDDTNAEAEVENPSVVCPGKHEPVPPKEGAFKQLEDNEDNAQLGGRKDDDNTDVEEDLDNPESGVNTLPPTVHKDVDTDAEDSSVKGETPSRTKNNGVGGHSDSEDVDTDVEDSSAKGKTPSRTKNHVVGGHSDGEDVDTDVEDSSAKGKTPSRTKNRVVGGHSDGEDVDTDVEDSSVKGRTPNRTKNCVVGGHSDGEDVDRDVEDSSAKGKTPGRTKNRVVGGHSDGEDVDTDVEDSSVKGKTPGRIKNCGVGGQSNGADTKEETIKPQLENSEDTCAQRTCSSSGKESSTDMEEVSLKKIESGGHSVSERHGDVVGVTKNSEVELEMSYEDSDKSPRDFDKKEPSPNPMQPNLPMLFLGSDTDEEEEAGNPDVESKKRPPVSGAESSKGSRVSCLGDSDVGSREKPPDQDKDSDINEEVTSVGHDKSRAQDSDTDTKDVAPFLLRKPLEVKSFQIIIPGRSQVEGEPLASSAVGIGGAFKPREDNEDTDAEREESYSADESNTDDELDVSLQATQCYLSTESTPSGPEKAGGITATVSDSDCALEEEPTQSFDFSPHFLPTKHQFRNVTSSPLKDNSSDQEDDILEATQPFCEEPEQVSAEPCEALTGKEKRLAQDQPEEDKCFEPVPQPDFPAATSPGEETTSSLPGDHLPPQAVALPSMQSPLQTPEGAPEEDPQPLPSVQIPLVASKGSLTPQEEKRVEVLGSGSPSSEVVPRQSEATPVGDGVEENSELIRETRNTKKVLVPTQEDPVSATPPARELRRSLRSSTTSPSPTPVPERRSLRRHGSGAVVASSTPAAPETRRRGLRQLSNASQRMRIVKERPQQPEEEEGPRKKARNEDLNAAPIPQGRTRSSQRESTAARKVTEVAKAVSGSNPGAREPTKRVRGAPAPDRGLEGQREHPRTRASKLSSSSSSASVSTPSPKDSGKDAKPAQEPVSTPSSGRRLRCHSPESKATSQKASSGSRSRRATGPGSPAPKVLFTGVIDEEGERVVAELGGTLAESVFDCTHLVTDRVRRTVKFLCALARGIPIVTLDWLEKSRRNAFFLAPNNFLVRDPEQEKNLRFNLSTSLQTAQQKGALFQGYEIHVTPNVKPEPEHMKDIVKCSGGTLLPRMPRAFKEKRIVVSCPEDLLRCKPAQEARVPITNAEFILTGILQQTVDLEAHRLDGNTGPSPASSPLVPSTRTSKRRAATQTAPAPPSTAKRRR